LIKTSDNKDCFLRFRFSKYNSQINAVLKSWKKQKTNKQLQYIHIRYGDKKGTCSVHLVHFVSMRY